MHTVLYLYDLPRFDSTAAFKLLNNYIMAKVK